MKATMKLQKCLGWNDDENNEIYYSTASVWEVAIKHSIRPDDMIVDGRLFEKGCEDNAIRFFLFLIVILLYWTP